MLCMYGLSWGSSDASIRVTSEVIASRSLVICCLFGMEASSEDSSSWLGGIESLLKVFAIISLITCLIPLVTSKNASSRFGQLVIGLPFVGKGWSFPKGASLQSTGFKITG